VIGLAGQFAAVEETMTGRENLEMVARRFGLGRKQAKAAAAERHVMPEAAARAGWPAYWAGR
jgi:ABC-type Na+ transport system ATPase subunit NatA